jgi:hypothetical protein
MGPACLAGVLWALLMLACGSARAASAEAAGGRFTDPEDGFLDITTFLDSRYGFVPVLSPITEPAVGYGAAGALLFIDRKDKGDPQAAPKRPNIFAVGGLVTENGTDGLFAGHMGTWRDGSLRSLVGIADVNANLHFAGLGEDTLLSTAFDYNVSATGGLAGLEVRIKESPFWLGLRYLFADTRVVFDVDAAQIPDQLPDASLQLGALTPSITYDTRNNFFTATRGLYLSLEYPLFRDLLGSDRDFEAPRLTGIWYHPLGETLFLGVRASAKDSSDGTPFFLLPFVSLRGLEALSVVGDRAFEAEAELRWQFHPRFSAVGFVGGGQAHSSLRGQSSSEGVLTGGGGLRYLLARGFGLHMGLDIGFGPGDPVIYVVFGSNWLRP